MGRTGTRMPGFCLNRIRPHVLLRSPPPLQSKPDISVNSKLGVNSCKIDKEADDFGQFEPNGDSSKTSTKVEDSGKYEATEKPKDSGRKIMVVIDSSIEAKGALQWALSHTIQSQDVVILLHVTKPSKQCQDPNKVISPRVQELVNSMKKLCQLKIPEVQVETTIIEGKDKGPTIVKEARKRGVGLLVLGQKKQPTTWRLLMVWTGHRVIGGVVDYCVQNASCMAVAVRRKSKKLGGYLITTKRHKDFWLLA